MANPNAAGAMPVMLAVFLHSQDRHELVAHGGSFPNSTTQRRIQRRRRRLQRRLDRYLAAFDFVPIAAPAAPIQPFASDHDSLLSKIPVPLVSSPTSH